jgi:hypothetical protein
VEAVQVIESMDDLLTKYPASATARQQRVERSLSSMRE